MRKAWLLTMYAAAVVGCANNESAPRCTTQRWEGECQLASVTKVEDAEFPIPHVVMEAVYRPVTNAQYPQYTPAVLVERTMAKAQHELALYDYLEAHPRVACRAEAPP